MALLDQLRMMRDREATLLADAGPYRGEIDGLRAKLVSRAVALLAATGDEDLVDAFRQASRTSGDTEADVLRAEIDRRGLDV